MENIELTPAFTLEVLEQWKKEGYKLIDMYIRPEKINGVTIIDLKPLKKGEVAIDTWNINDREFVLMATQGSPGILYLVKGTLPDRGTPDCLLIFGRTI